MKALLMSIVIIMVASSCLAALNPSPRIAYHDIAKQDLFYDLSSIDMDTRFLNQTTCDKPGIATYDLVFVVILFTLYLIVTLRNTV